ncbi:MAG: TonB-dependent receptor, partial [Gammaproteobacteria bacterium]|nr:TonB-dependent receptor [Gammaproteobacteria bacterium]
KETQFGATEGSAFLVATRPQGKHYDYDVTSRSIAPYLQADIDVSDRLTLSAGVRLEYLHYDYDNRMLSGNTRDDGSACGFGGCLYTRPASRSDSFTNAAPKLGFNYRLSTAARLYGNLARGFRAPQATELYRLQSGQQVADLDSENIDSIEIGVRFRRPDWSADMTLFAMKKRDSVLRDAEGFNISGGRSRHNGIEAALDWQINRTLLLRLNSSYARHVYDFELVAARGETFVSGNDVDTAPRWLGSAELLYEPDSAFDFSVRWTAIGDYYLDAQNRFSYPGHDLVNLRAGIALTPRLDLSARLNNMLDSDYADRADYAFGDYRYFPGRGRELFVELKFLPNAAGD